MGKKVQEKRNLTYTYKYFNTRDYVIGSVMAQLHDFCSKWCREHKLAFARWDTAFHKNAMLTKAHQYNLETKTKHFERWWLDQLTTEYEHMLWNCVFNANKDDKKADRKADEAIQEFYKEFA